MPNFFHTFRGVERTIEYTDHGWDSETNDSGIEWSFADDEMQDVEPTPEEDQEIVNIIADITMHDDD